MYQSLYRKYRPKHFNEVYGQECAKKILINTLKNSKLSHAYLFFGPRGTGKTSIAKMFARACNCLDIKDGECCEKCDNCKESSQKNCVDIIEIDAASNNGVDEIRELKNKINLVPNKLLYKVYIVDEVHMLSTGAFNALLKTLEEPPEHVIFILATTEYYKVPATIVSRCQCIEFKNIDDDSMTKRLNEIAKAEKIKIDDDSIDEIVRNSNGGLRDAIGLLDKANSFTETGEKIKVDDVRNILGTISEEELTEIVNLIETGDSETLLKRMSNLVSTGKDVYKILGSVINLSIKKSIDKKKYGLVDKVKIMYRYYNDLRKTSNKLITLEVMILELSKTNVRENISREIFLEDKPKKSDVELPKSEQVDLNLLSKKIDVRINNSFANANKKQLNDLKEQWIKLKDDVFDSNDGSYICDLLDANPVVVSDTNIMLSSEYESIVDKINLNDDIYQKILFDKLNSEKKLVVVSLEKWQSLKKDYMTKTRDGHVFEYISEDEIVSAGPIKNKKDKLKKDDIIETKAKELFGEMFN